jgi:hypothetical protein
VRLDHVGLDPVCDGGKRISIALRELARPSDVLEILEEEDWWSVLAWNLLLKRAEDN